MYDPGTPFYGYTFSEHVQPGARPTAVRSSPCAGRRRLRHRLRPVRDALPPRRQRPEPARTSCAPSAPTTTATSTRRTTSRPSAPATTSTSATSRPAARSRRPAHHRRSTRDARRHRRHHARHHGRHRRQHGRRLDRRRADPGAVDDPGMAIDVSQIFIRTNGDITGDRARRRHARRPHPLHATATSTLNSPQRILDADGRPTIDVTGINITMYAGEAGGIGGIGAADRLPRDQHLGARSARRPGRPPSDGVLKAYDTDGRRRTTAGHLPRRAHRRHAAVRGLHRTATRALDHRQRVAAHASAARSSTPRTTRPPTTSGPDSVDIDANGGSIGLASNDLEVDSAARPPFACTNVNCGEQLARRHRPDRRRSPPPATTSPSRRPAASTSPRPTRYLRLAARARARRATSGITVRETGATLDEDLYLIKNGSAQLRRERHARCRAPTPTPRATSRTARSSPRTAASSSGSATTSRSTRTAQILADLSIDIRGDYGNADTGGTLAVPDPEYGTIDDPPRPHHRRLRRHRRRRRRRPDGHLRAVDREPGRRHARPTSGAAATSTSSSSATRPASTSCRRRPRSTRRTLGERRLHLPRLEDDDPRQRDAARSTHRRRRGPHHGLVPAVDERRRRAPTGLQTGSRRRPRR